MLKQLSSVEFQVTSIFAAMRADAAAKYILTLLITHEVCSKRIDKPHQQILFG